MAKSAIPPRRRFNKLVLQEELERVVDVTIEEEAKQRQETVKDW